jgi:DNA/RNA endonuclease YhcR with UshA esterase domain
LHLLAAEEQMKKFAPLAIALMVLAACATGHPKIAELKYNPGRYQNRSVTVDGVVTTSWGVPLVPFKLYKVNDGTGEVTVLSQDGRAPTKGARVSVKGRVTEFATFGGQSLGLHLRQEHLKFRGY